MIIEECKQRDLKTLFIIQNEAGLKYSEIVKNFDPDVPFIPFSELEEAFEQRIVFFKILVDNEIAGFVGYKKMDELALVRFFNILPKYQRRGTGEKLYKHLENRARTDRVKKLLLIAHKDAYWAIKFYKKQGFSIIPKPKASFINKYWQPPEGMQKALAAGFLVVMNKSL